APRSKSAEFPNDNPCLHDGAVWVCRAPTERPRPMVRPHPTQLSWAPVALGAAPVVASAPAAPEVAEIIRVAPAGLPIPAELASETVPESTFSLRIRQALTR